MAGTRSSVLTTQWSNSWLTVVAGPQGAMRTVNQRVERTLDADCLVRITHLDLREAGATLESSGGEMARVELGDRFVLDDGEMLVANKLDAWRLPLALQAQAKRDPALAARLAMEKLGGSPAPEITAKQWLNAEKPPTWKTLRGKVVLLVLFDAKQPLFAPLVAPLSAFKKTYGEKGLTIIGIHAQAPRDEVEKRLTEEHVDFPVLIDDGTTENRFGIGFFACLLIDRKGKVASAYKDSLAPPADIEKLVDEKGDDQ